MGHVRIGAENLRPGCSCCRPPRRGHWRRLGLLRRQCRCYDRDFISNSPRTRECTKRSIVLPSRFARGSSCRRPPTQQPGRHNPSQGCARGYTCRTRQARSADPTFRLNLTVARGTPSDRGGRLTGKASHLDPSGIQDLLAAISQQCRASSLWEAEMRALILAVVGGLALTASALAAPLAPERASNELGSRPIELVDHACEWGRHPVRWQDHWGHWHRHCVPYGHAHQGTRLEHPYADWRAPTGGWGNP